MVRKKRALWHAFKRTRSPHSYWIHREFSNQLSSVIKEARFTYEKKIAGDKDLKRLFKLVRTSLSGPVKKILVKSASDTIVSNASRVADIFAETFSTIFTVEPTLGGSTLSTPPNRRSIQYIDFTSERLVSRLSTYSQSYEQHGFLTGKSVQSNLLCCLSN